MTDLVVISEVGATVVVQEVSAANILEITSLGPQGPKGDKGDTTVVSGVVSFNTRTGDISLTASDVTNALTYTPQNSAARNAVNGYAGLDSSGLIPATLLPSYVDDVLEYANLSSFPATGDTGKIYVAINTSKPYRWSGSVYVEITASAGSTDSITEGTTNLYFTTARSRAAISATGSISYTASTGVISYTAPTALSAFTNDTGFITSSALSGYQTTLVSGTSIKSVNGSSLLGSGDLTISAVPAQTSQSGKFLTTNGTSASWADPLPTQTSQTGRFLTTNGTSASWATVDALPTQTSQSGKFLTTNGTSASWADPLPTQTSQSGRFLTTNGTSASWAAIDALPTQTSQSGKFLTTNGASASWADPLPTQTSQSGKFLTTNGTSASWGTVDLSSYLTSASATSTYFPLAGGTLSGAITLGSSTGTAGATMVASGSSTAPSWRPRVTKSTTAPPNPVDGDSWLDPSSGGWFMYITADSGAGVVSSGWVEIGRP